MFSQSAQKVHYFREETEDFAADSALSLPDLAPA